MVVTDTGGGMSAAAQSRLFEPFFASEDGGGSAVGLAKVDAIVKQAGGRIQVDVGGRRRHDVHDRLAGHFGTGSRHRTGRWRKRG